jgi:predicted cobalt transporter CbtA
MGVIIALLVVWLAFVIVGFAIKTLLWLAIVGIVLFVATGIYGGNPQPNELRRC